MAKNNNNKKRKKSNLNPLVRLALKNELKKRVESEEEREKIMLAFESLDMKTLLTDPDALAAVMSNPAEELKNYMLDSDKEDTEEVSEVSVDVDSTDDVTSDASDEVPTSKDGDNVEIDASVPSVDC